MGGTSDDISVYLNDVKGLVRQDYFNNETVFQGPGFESRWRYMFFTLVKLIISKHAGKWATPESLHDGMSGITNNVATMEFKETKQYSSGAAVCSASLVCTIG